MFPESTSPSPELLRRLHLVAEEIQKGIAPLSYPELEAEVRYFLDQSFETSKAALPEPTSTGIARVTQNPYPNKKIKLLVVLVGFSDRPMAQQAREEINRKLFSDPERSAAAYYREVSGGKVELDGHIIGPIQLADPLSHYLSANYGRDGSPAGGKILISDAARAALREIKTFAPFCHRPKSAHVVDGFVVIHSAAPAEWDSGGPRELWSSKVDTYEDGTVIDPQGYRVQSGCLFGETSPLGVVVHELAHLLFGFVDLYAQPPVQFAGAGRWCLMGSGNWLGGLIYKIGTVPAHLSAWMKINQGWVTPTDVRNPSSMSLADIKEKGHVVRLFPNGDVNSKEYFIVEHRRKRNFDADLPGEGLLIWRIDESQSGNSNPNAPFISLVQADGLDDLRTARNQGDASDPYTGSNNPSFGPNTKPNSLSRQGKPTNIRVSRIQKDPQESGAISFRVHVRKDFNPSAGFEVASPSEGYLELHGCDMEGRHFWVSSAERHHWTANQYFDFDNGLLFKKDVPPVLVCREEGTLDLFMIGKDGRVHAAWKPDGVWHGWGAFADLPLSSPGSIAAFSIHTGHMSLTAHGADGRIYHTEWDGNHPTSWTPWQPLFSDTFSRDTPIVALAEAGSDRGFVFAAKEDGSLWVCPWQGGEWRAWEPLKGGKLLGEKGRITAIQRQPERVDVYILDKTGACYVQFCEQGRWTGVWNRIGTATFDPASHLVATLKEGQINLVVAGQDGTLAGTWWRGDSWNDWYSPNGGLDRLIPGGHLAFTSPTMSEMVVFGRTRDEYLYACTWKDGAWLDWELI